MDHGYRRLVRFIATPVGLTLAVWGLVASTPAPAAAQSVTSFTLVDADTDLDIGPLEDGDTINLATTPSQNLNVRANTSPGTVGSVVFGLDGDGSYATENVAPYALEGDSNGDYNAWTPSLGAHTLTATAYAESGGGGSSGPPLTIEFDVVDQAGPLPPVADAGPDRYVFLPTTAVTIEGSATDGDGVVTDYAWTQESGAPTTLVGEDTPTLEVTGLAEGDYTFRLTVTDDDDQTDSDDVVVHVLPEGGSGGTVSGTREKWHRVTVTFVGPATAETASPNPFRDYRLDVTFVHDGGASYTVPGHYAADGDAAESSAGTGGLWRVHFSPDRTGEWSYVASFRSGPDVAIAADPLAGAPASFDGASGTFVVDASGASGRDHRAKGRLEYVGDHHLRFAETDEYFLKGGADSPENFLGYFEFDDTVDQGGSGNDLQNGLHRYEPHVGDWSTGDPSWQGGKGKGIIGALNYLASEGMNSVYFLTMNVQGDGQEVYPWTQPGTRDRFDVSKLDQWEIVFSHMDAEGLMLHVITQETENDQLLDGGALGTQRKLYYRELVSRFGHHLAVVWNLGEENTNTDAQRKAFADFIRELDPYDHPIVVHTYPGSHDGVYEPLLGFDNFDGPSIQTSAGNAHDTALTWRAESVAAGKKWFVSLDEIGPAGVGVVPDSEDPDHDTVRQDALWGNLMGGGAGCEWYFGYNYPHNDLDCEDWRSRDAMWDQTRHALTFFQEHLPFWEMSPDDDLVSGGAYCLAKAGETYAIYLADGGSTTLDLTGHSGAFSVEWYDPRSGGARQDGTVTEIAGGEIASIGDPPSATGEDWVALVTADDVVPVDPTTGEPAPSPHELALLRVTPNPVSGSARVPFVIPAAGPVRLGLYDLSGRLVRTLVDGPLPAGTHAPVWNGRDGSGRRAAPGVYFTRLEWGEEVRTARLLRVE